MKKKFIQNWIAKNSKSFVRNILTNNPNPLETVTVIMLSLVNDIANNAVTLTQEDAWIKEAKLIVLDNLSEVLIEKYYNILDSCKPVNRYN